MTNKIDINKQYTTRSGLPVRIYAVDVGNKEYTVHGCFFEANEWNVASWKDNGMYHDDIVIDDLDLFKIGE